MLDLNINKEELGYLRLLIDLAKLQNEKISDISEELSTEEVLASGNIVPQS